MFANEAFEPINMFAVFVAVTDPDAVCVVPVFVPAMKNRTEFDVLDIAI